MSKVTQEMAESESIHRNMIAARPDVPKLLVQRTEAEWREEARNEFDANANGLRQLDPWASHMLGFLAALRLVGAIKEE